MSAELAILGLLVEQPFHGYGIAQLIEARGMRSWTPVGFSSIYQQLDHLVSEGFAEAQVSPAPGRGKERRVHYVTTKGRERWRAASLAALAEVTDTDGDFLLALSGLPFLDKTQATEALQQRRRQLESQIAQLDLDLEQVRPVPEHVEAMFVYTRTRLVASHTWLETFLSQHKPQQPEV